MVHGHNCSCQVCFWVNPYFMQELLYVNGALAVVPLRIMMLIAVPHRGLAAG